MVVVEPYAYLLTKADLIVVNVTNPDDILEAGRYQVVPPGTGDLGFSEATRRVIFSTSASKRF